MCFVKLLGICLAGIIFSGCASLFRGTPVSSPPKYLLKFKGEKGRIEVVKVRSVTAKKNTGEDQISRSNIESVNFELVTETSAVNSLGVVTQKQTVRNKSGEDINLHDMGFPEVGETIEMEYTSSGEVLSAGRFPKNSVFFVPQVSLPKDEVSIGDTWELETSWVNLTGIEMHLNLISIFKRQVVCGDQSCADIEFSGSVRIPGLKGFAKTSIEIYGRVLFSIEMGAVVWQEIRNKEKLEFKNYVMAVESCLKVIAVEPELAVISSQQLGCSVPFEAGINVPL